MYMKKMEVVGSPKFDFGRIYRISRDKILAVKETCCGNYRIYLYLLTEGTEGKIYYWWYSPRRDYDGRRYNEILTEIAEILKQTEEIARAIKVLKREIPPPL